MEREEVERIVEEKIIAKFKEIAKEEENPLLHSMPHMEGSPGIVIDEAKARATPCKCVEYKPGKKICWSPGILGSLTNEQERIYCPTTIKVERPGTVERMRKWQEAVDVCKLELEPVKNGERRVTAWLRCMSVELGKRGIKP